MFEVPDALTLLLLGLGAYRFTLILTTDVVTETFREKIWSKFPPSTKFGYLFTCNWCMGFWVSLLWVLGWVFAPDVLVVVSLVLAISAVIGLLSDATER